MLSNRKLDLSLEIRTFVEQNGQKFGAQRTITTFTMHTIYSQITLNRKVSVAKQEVRPYLGNGAS